MSILTTERALVSLNTLDGLRMSKFVATVVGLLLTNVDSRFAQGPRGEVERYIVWLSMTK